MSLGWGTLDRWTTTEETSVGRVDDLVQSLVCAALTNEDNTLSEALNDVARAGAGLGAYPSTPTAAVLYIIPNEGP
ncbi:hypothetical protein ACU8KH_03655 [Lachancea thermotolerans]